MVEELEQGLYGWVWGINRWESGTKAEEWLVLSAGVHDFFWGIEGESVVKRANIIYTGTYEGAWGIIAEGNAKASESILRFSKMVDWIGLRENVRERFKGGRGMAHVTGRAFATTLGSWERRLDYPLNRSP